jgi:hypothetical protein
MGRLISMVGRPIHPRWAQGAGFRAVFLHAGRVDAIVDTSQPAAVAARLHALGERANRDDR